MRDASHNHNTPNASSHKSIMTPADKETLKTLLARIGRRWWGVVPGSRIVKSSTAPADLTMRPPVTSGLL